VSFEDKVPATADWQTPRIKPEMTNGKITPFFIAVIGAFEPV
jgi:hypothetical protein